MRQKTSLKHEKLEASRAKLMDEYSAFVRELQRFVGPANALLFLNAAPQFERTYSKVIPGASPKEAEAQLNYASIAFLREVFGETETPINVNGQVRATKIRYYDWTFSRLIELRHRMHKKGIEI